MTTLEIICLYGLGISLCLLLFDAAGKTLRAAWRRNGRRYGVAASLIGLAVVCTINAQKPGPTPVITVDAFLRDAGSYATNNVLHVAVTNAPAYAGIDFSSCPVLVYARPRGLSDAPEWEELLPRRTFSELPADYAIEDATNYNYLVYLDYVPPSPVHTNGVFELRGFVVPGDEPGNLEQLAAGFINSRAILPPPTARDYIQDGLIAMWDGIERGDNPLVWGDVTGNGWDLTVTSGSVWLDDALSCSDYQRFGIASMPNRLIPAASVEHVEITCFVTKRQNNPLIFYNGSSGLKGAKNIVIAASTVGVETSENMRHTACKLTTGLFRISATWEKLYIDGERVTDTTFTRDTWSGGSESFALFGRSNDSNYAAAGRVYCVRIYNRELTTEEIEHNYKIDKERFNLP